MSETKSAKSITRRSTRSAPKKVRASSTKAASSEGETTSKTKRKAPAKRKAKPKAKAKAEATPISPQIRHEMIACAAYFRAEHRSFAPGHELDDWLTAEQSIEQQLAAPA